MTISAPYSLTKCRRFFTEPATARQRQYEALRAFFVERLPSAEAARRFGYSPGAFRVLCHAFRRARPAGILRHRPHRPARAAQEEPCPRADRGAAQAQLLGLRDQPGAQGAGNAAERHRGARGSRRGGLRAPAAPARRGAARSRVGPDAEAVANVQDFALTPREFTTRIGGLFLFVPDLVRLDGDDALGARRQAPGLRA